MNDTQKAPRLPERVGPYRLERMLGEGGMDIVYAGLDSRLDRRVAIKMIRSALDDSRSRERFWREARAARSSRHEATGCSRWRL